MLVILILDTDFNDDDKVADYPIVESYNLPLGKVPSRIEPFTSPFNLAKTHLNKKRSHIFTTFFKLQYLPPLWRTHKGLAPEVLDQLNAGCFDCGTPSCTLSYHKFPFLLALIGNIGMSYLSPLGRQAPKIGEHRFHFGRRQIQELLSDQIPCDHLHSTFPPIY